jgi:hypothetical protein
VDYRADLLSHDPQDRHHETLRAFVAPVAHESDAVSKDPVALEVAEAIYEACGNSGKDGGLTRSELAEACRKSVSPEAFESRFDLFVSMGLLRRYSDKSHQMHYVLNPVSVAALLVYDRLRELGGVEEIMLLLDRTKRELISGEITREGLTRRLARVKWSLSVFADNLQHLVRDRSWEELLAERTHHRSADALLTEAKDLVAAVSSHFPDLAGAGARLVNEALRYSSAVNDFCDRLLEQATARRDFSMLLPEQYRSAALNCGKNELAMPFARTVFDPPRAILTAEQLADAIEAYRPRPDRRRPPRPPDMPSSEDPVKEVRRRASAERERIEALAELQLQGGREVDLTGAIRSTGWRDTARIVTDTLAAHAHPDVPVQVLLARALIVDAVGPVSHVTPMALCRVPQRSAIDYTDTRGEGGND